MSKNISCAILACLLSVSAYSQSGTNSPYSQYGIGVLSDQSQGFSRGMNGAGVGLRQGNIVNAQNPASYSSIDSLTMIFDAGVSGQVTHFREAGASVNANNASFDYFMGSFRLMKNVGIAFGLLPVSNVGYKYSTSTYLDRTNGSVTKTYTGSGGLHQVVLGAGWRVAAPLSVGVNVAYLWGSIDRTAYSSSTTYINSLSRIYSVSVSSYNLDFGVQWSQQLGRRDALTVGATVGVGHKLGADPSCMVINVSNADTTSFKVSDGLALPMTYSLGGAWVHGGKLTVAADIIMQAWGGVDYPEINAAGQYVLQSGLLKDRYQVKVGADFVPNATSRNLLHRVHYRAGAGYATPYYKVNGADGPKEFSVSAGFGIPLQNAYNNRSILNISAQWVHASARDLITENTFRLNLGLTFNERWFAKWKID